MTKAIPHLTCRNCTEAIGFYERAFGATSQGVMNSPDGKVMHAALDIDGAAVYLVDEFPDFGGKSPQMLGGTPVTVHLQVENADSVFATATTAGCTVLMPLELQFWGDKFGLLSDPYGHQWSVGQPVEQKTPEEIRAALEAMPNDPACGPGN